MQIIYQTHLMNVNSSYNNHLNIYLNCTFCVWALDASDVTK